MSMNESEYKSLFREPELEKKLQKAERLIGRIDQKLDSKMPEHRDPVVYFSNIAVVGSLRLKLEQDYLPSLRSQIAGIESTKEVAMVEIFNKLMSLYESRESFEELAEKGAPMSVALARVNERIIYLEGVFDRLEQKPKQEILQKEEETAVEKVEEGKAVEVLSIEVNEQEKREAEGAKAVYFTEEEERALILAAAGSLEGIGDHEQAVISAQFELARSKIETYILEDIVDEVFDRYHDTPVGALILEIMDKVKKDLEGEILSEEVVTEATPAEKKVIRGGEKNIKLAEEKDGLLRQRVREYLEKYGKVFAHKRTRIAQIKKDTDGVITENISDEARKKNLVRPRISQNSEAEFSFNDICVMLYYIDTQFSFNKNQLRGLVGLIDQEISKWQRAQARLAALEKKNGIKK